MNNIDNISALDWAILNTLSDDYESIRHIYEDIITNTILEASTTDILISIEHLYLKNYVYLMQDNELNKANLQAEIDNLTDDKKYWFGRTDSGSEVWQSLTEKYESITEQIILRDKRATCP